MSLQEFGFRRATARLTYGRNLTPDKETGLGNWNSDDIVKAIRTGVRLDGRELAPIMPWQAFSYLTDDDAYAIAAYLKSLPPVQNKVLGPVGPNETPTGFVIKVVLPASKTAAANRIVHGQS
jgi:hypothetical protein